MHLGVDELQGDLKGQVKNEDTDQVKYILENVDGEERKYIDDEATNDKNRVTYSRHLFGTVFIALVEAGVQSVRGGC